MGGCCFGIPYKGIGAVIFPDGVNQLSGVEVFPVQLLEAIVALFICIIMLFFKKNKIIKNSVSLYMILYGSTRFVMEFLRYNSEDVIISGGNICSILCVLIGIIICIINKLKTSNSKGIMTKSKQ